MRIAAFIACCLLLALVPVIYPDPYTLSVVGAAGIMIIAAMSLNLLLGYTGQLSLGHVAFFGIGAYASALCALGFDVYLGFGYTLVVTPKPVWLAFAVGILAAALSGWIIGRLSFKVRGAYFVIVTICFAQVMRLVSLNWVDLTEGPMALSAIPPLTFWHPTEGVTNITSKAGIYWLVLGVGIVCYMIIAGFVNSRVGRAAIALRENETLARSIGIKVTHYLVLTTLLSAGMAGAAGALYAHTVRIIDPDVFLFIYTITMVIMVIAGGKGTLAGPVIGGMIFGLLPEVLRGVVEPEIQWILYGALMILILLFLPKGIVPAFMQVLNRISGKRSLDQSASPMAGADPAKDVAKVGS